MLPSVQAAMPDYKVSTKDSIADATVYQNTSGRAQIVTVGLACGGVTDYCQVSCDTSNPPTTNILSAELSNVVNSMTNISFVVPDREFFKCVCGATMTVSKSMIWSVS